jgi:hypothetical protein
MKKWFPGLLLIAVVMIVFLMFRGGRREQQGKQTDRQQRSSTSSDKPSQALAGTTNFISGNALVLSAVEAEEKRKAFMREKIASVPPPTMPQMTNISPQVVIENMRGVFQQYAQRFGANPVGTNPEITAALTGSNPKQVVFIKADDALRVNDQGELVDSWGTPFFFHQLSAREMEIHSAGPDRVMWTADDLVTK